jgi:hypothetical protein
MSSEGSIVESFFSESGKLICLELLKSDQISINNWLLNQMEYRDKLEKNNMKRSLA